MGVQKMEGIGAGRVTKYPAPWLGFFAFLFFQRCVISILIIITPPAPHLDQDEASILV